MTDSGTAQIEATAEDYLEHAKEVNSLAGTALHMGRKDVFTLSKKISLGLSLQAIELAGKGMLRALGHSVQQIRQQHKNHDLLTLLKNVELELQQRPEQDLIKYHHFLLWTPKIDSVQFGNTFAAYLKLHFSKGASAFPRSYFYPDELLITGPRPIQALFVMSEHIIEVAEKIVTILKT